MITYKWHARFTISNLLSNGPQKSDLIAFDSEPTDDGGHRVGGNATFESSQPMPKDEALLKTQSELQVLFSLDLRSAYEIVIEEFNLVNEEELLTAGQSIVNVADVGGFMTITGQLRSPNDLPEVWAKLQKARESNVTEILLPIRWFLRAAQAKDFLDQFINSWVAFEALYSRYVSGRTSAYKGVHGLISNDVPIQVERSSLVASHRGIVDALSKLTIIDHRRREDKGQILKDAIAAKEDDDSIFEKTFLAISTIRNYLFHGNLQDRSKDAKLCWPLVIDLDSRIIKHELSKL